MKKLTTKNEQGFTIIEVVLVLAIAGLIFLIVFLALPQLQRSRRDTQRQNDAGRIVAAVENFAGNHSGKYPATIDTTWLTNNVGDGSANSFADPSTGTAYTTGIVTNGSALGTTAAGTVEYTRGHECNTTGLDGTTAVTPTTDRIFAIELRLESGAYCQDNK